jgi:Flp pilus assembly protein TadD
LARLFVLRQEWAAAADASRQALRLHPFHLEARETLLLCYLQLGDRSQARMELDRLLSLHPPHADALRRRYEPQLR